MREIKTKVGKHPYIQEQFGSMNELITVLETRSEQGWVGEDGSRRKDREYFKDVKYKDAKNYARFGYDNQKAIKMFDQAINSISDKKLLDKNKSVSFHSVAGGKPIVANALMGLPKSMIARKTVLRKARIVNVFVESSFSAGTSSSSVLQWGAELVGQIVNLEKQGWRVRLNSISTFGEPSGTKQIHGMSVVIKDENQPIDLKRLIFPITHVGFFRALGFDWYETLPGSQSLSGYGTPVYRWDESMRNDYLKTIGGENFIYVMYGDDIKEKFKNVK